MRKKLFLTAFFVASLTVVPLLSAAKESPTKAVQQTVVPAIDVDSIMGAVTGKATKVEYTLPYPGIGPDHPLFFLKRFRDWLILTLTVDPFKKSDFYLLQANKRLGMATALIAKGELTLAQQMFSEEAVYMELALAPAQGAKTSGRLVPGHILDRLERATTKHVEVLGEVGKTAPIDLAASVSQALSSMQKLQQEVEKLK